MRDTIVPDMPLTLYRRHVAACVKKRQQAGDTLTAAAIRSDRSLRRCLWFAIIPSARKRFTVRRMKGNNGDTCRRYFYRSFGSFGFC